MMQESILSPFPTNIDSYSADVAPIVDYVMGVMSGAPPC